MRVAVVRTGGFAGLIVHAEVDTETLSGESADDVERLAREVVGCAPPAAGSEGADRFAYEVRVEQQVWRVGESGLTGPWQELVDVVLSLRGR